MITALGLYIDKDCAVPDAQNIKQAVEQFRTDQWEFNCYSQDITCVTEHTASKPKYALHWINNHTTGDHHRRLAKAVQRHFDSTVDRKYFQRLGLFVEPMEMNDYIDEMNWFCGGYNQFADTMAQLAAMPQGAERNSPIVFNRGWDLKLQHDPWRYFKILKNDEVNRRSMKSSGEDQGRPPINSSNTVFCRSRDTIDQHCIGHYHALYTLTRPQVATNTMRYQLVPQFNTLSSFRWSNITELVAEHCALNIVTYDEFEEYERDYWNRNDVDVNRIEYASSNKNHK